MKKAKRKIVSLIAADITIALLTVQAKQVKAATVSSTHEPIVSNLETDSVSTLTKQIGDQNNINRADETSTISVNSKKNNKVDKNVSAVDTNKVVRLQSNEVDKSTLTTSTNNAVEVQSNKSNLFTQQNKASYSPNFSYVKESSKSKQATKVALNTPTAWIKIIDEDNNVERDAFGLLYDKDKDKAIKETYTTSGVPEYATQNSNIYTIMAPEGYYFDIDYFAPKDPKANNYDKIRSPYYSNVTRQKIDFDVKNAFLKNSNLKLNGDTFNLWVVKDGKFPNKSLISDKLGQKEERIDWYSNDSGKYVGSQKFYISDSEDADMAKTYEVEAPEGYYFYTDYATEFGYRTPQSGYVFQGNNYYPPIDLNGEKATIINGKEYYKKGLFHVYDAIKEGYFNKENYNCNSTSLHIFRLWLVDPNYKSQNAAPLRANGTATQLGGAVVRYYDSNTGAELTDYSQVYNGKAGSIVKYKPVLPTMSNAEWVIDGNKTDIEEIPSYLKLSTTPSPVKIFVMRKDNTSVIKFYGDDGSAAVIKLNGKAGDKVYVRNQIINELEKLAQKGYKLPNWYNQNNNIIEATSNGNSRVTAYGDVPSYVKLAGTTDIYNSYKNIPLYIKVEKVPKDLQYFVIKYVDDKGNQIKNTNSQIFYNYTKTGRVESVEIPDSFYSVPNGYDNITGKISNYKFSDKSNKEILIVAHKKNILKSIWINKNGKLYYYDENGNLVKDTIKELSGNVYSFASDGSIEKNAWRERNGKKYYFGWNGVAYSNCVTIVGGIKYRFDATGRAFVLAN